jgi:AraC-like DNA-binding protein
MESRAEWVTALPSPGLRPFIDRYVGYRMTGFAPGVHLGLPSRHMTFIVSVGSPIDVVAQSDNRRRPERYGCVVSGLQASAARIAHDGNQEGVAIELTPLGCRAVFGMPARALWNLSVECTEVAGVAGLELWERLQGPAAWADRFAACDEVLGRQARGHRAEAPDVTVAPELRHAWTSLIRSGGTAPVAALAADVGWSRQHLARRFGDEFGLGPKLAARVVRLDRARHLLQSTPSSVTIAQVAASCGYYDQSHLDRDFAELAGCSPRAWLAEELPSFQDDVPVTV